MTDCHRFGILAAAAIPIIAVALLTDMFVIPSSLVSANVRALPNALGNTSSIPIGHVFLRMAGCSLPATKACFQSPREQKSAMCWWVPTRKGGHHVTLGTEWIISGEDKKSPSSTEQYER